VASLAELVRQHGRYDAAQISHLQRLVASWGPLADLCFSDLLLFVPVAGEGGRRFVIVGQVRPSTNQTLYRDDFVGDIVDVSARPLISRALRTGEIVEGEVNLAAIDERVRMLAIPVRFNGEVTRASVAPVSAGRNWKRRVTRSFRSVSTIQVATDTRSPTSAARR
jgi:hypothetical protein